MGMSPPHMHIARYVYLSTVAWRKFHRHSMLRFRVIASQRQLVKSHFISHPSMPRHNSPDNRVSGIRRATPQDSSQVFHKTACVAPSSSVLDNTSPVKLAVCQGRLLARWRHSVRSLRTCTPTPRLIFPRFLPPLVHTWIHVWFYSFHPMTPYGVIIVVVSP